MTLCETSHHPADDRHRCIASYKLFFPFFFWQSIKVETRIGDKKLSVELYDIGHMCGVNKKGHVFRKFNFSVPQKWTPPINCI